MNRINDKIKEVEEFLENLKSYVPETFEEYARDNKTKDASERCFEKIMESVLDLAFLIIKEKNLSKPESEETALKTLANEGIIEQNLYLRLKDAKGMRNFIIHQYEKINDSLVFTTIKEELEKDINEFLDSIGRNI